MLSEKRRIHFIGIGGIGMSGIAELLLGLGHAISGSDLRQTQITERLARLGAEIALGHRPEHLAGAEWVVYSSAVKEDNPEVLAARQRGLVLLRRAEMLGELLRLKHGILVAGSHGKTTTTSMIATLLHAADLDPTVCVGGVLKHFGSNARLGSGEHFVAEADESDGSFTYLTPNIAVVTNIDREHMDHYRDMDEQRQAFARFLNQTDFDGLTVLCLDDPHLAQIAPLVRRRKLFYGLSRQAEWRAAAIELSATSSIFEVVERGETLGRLLIHQPGEHNVLNALAAVAVARQLGLSFDTIARGFQQLREIERRFQKRGERGGVAVYDDYGHHPTEIRATLKAARRACRGKLWVAFQPHRYSRTRDQWGEFLASFREADHLLLLPIYAAGEEAVAGIDSRRLAEEMRNAGQSRVSFCPDRPAALDALAGRLQRGDWLLTLGAGDIYRLGEEYLKA